MQWHFLRHYTAYFKGRSMQTNSRLLTSWIAKLNICGHSAHSLRFPDGTKSQPHKSWKQLGTRCSSQWGRWFRSRAIIRVKYVLNVQTDYEIIPWTRREKRKSRRRRHFLSPHCTIRVQTQRHQRQSVFPRLDSMYLSAAREDTSSRCLCICEWLNSVQFKQCSTQLQAKFQNLQWACALYFPLLFYHIFCDLRYEFLFCETFPAAATVCGSLVWGNC